MGICSCRSLVGCGLRGLATVFCYQRYLTIEVMMKMMAMVKIDVAAMMVMVENGDTGRYPDARCAMGLVPTGWTATVTIWVMAVSR